MCKELVYVKLVVTAIVSTFLRVLYDFKIYVMYQFLSDYDDINFRFLFVTFEGLFALSTHSVFIIFNSVVFSSIGKKISEKKLIVFDMFFIFLSKRRILIVLNLACKGHSCYLAFLDI